MFSARFKWNLETNRLAQLLQVKRRAGTRLLDLTQSNPTRAGLAYPAEKILRSLADPQAMLYDPTPFGLLAARQAIAAYYQQRAEIVAAEQICLTASTSEAYSWLFKLLTDQGDNVLVPTPSYPLFDFLAALEGVELRPYELTYTHPAGWKIDLDSIRRALTPQTRAIIAVSPNNPTGSFLKANEAESLAEFCGSHKLALIVDEVFADYKLNSECAGAPALRSFDSALTFTLNGFSKMLGLPQMKLGWIVTHGPAALQQPALERLELIADTFLSVNTPVQQAVPALLQLREEIQSPLRQRLRANLAWLQSETQPSACRTRTAEGGWSVILEVPRLYSDEDWALRLLEHENVVVHPGYFFDFASEGMLILSLLTEEREFREGAQRILKLAG